MTEANCPSCGAPIAFRIGSSEVVVCEYCRTVVARTDRGVEDYGKVAALIDTGSPLRIGTYGRHEGAQFRLSGRTQLRHQAGGVWDEWYAAFDDGRWGWLAEAQGRYYMTFEAAASAPRFDQLELGTRLEPYVVQELGTAELASAEGEIPWKPVPGSNYDYADLTGPERAFATIDYSEETPRVFRGKETSLPELGIKAEDARRTRVAVAKLSCSQCGGPLELRAPDQAERIYCPNCGAGHDIEQGNLRFFAKAKKKKVEPLIPLGSKGTIDGEEYVVAGFMERSVKFDIVYYWTEYLLFNPNVGFRWLVNSDDHWSFVRNIPAGEVDDAASAAYGGKYVRADGKRFRIFQQADAKVTYVVGEFYWKVAVGEKVGTVDYVAPPYGLSKEVTTSGAEEVNWSLARYMPVKEVEQAFGVEDLPRPKTVGPMQPFPGKRIWPAWLMMFALLLVIAMALAIRTPERVVAQHMFELTPADDAPAGRIFYVDAFDLSGNANVMIDAHSRVDNTWVYVLADLAHETQGVVASFEMPLEYYHGVSDGESWSEGSRSRDRFLSAPPKGRYSMRIEAQWEPGKNPPPLHVEIREGVFRFLHFFLALIAISIIPLLAGIRRLSFESQRWKDSDFSPFGTTSEEDDDE